MGKIVVQKDVGQYAVNGFNIVHITADKLVQLKQACSFTGGPIEASITLVDLLGMWQLTKIPVPMKLEVS